MILLYVLDFGFGFYVGIYGGYALCLALRGNAILVACDGVYDCWWTAGVYVS